MLPLVFLVTLALLGISSVALLNSLTFPRLRALKEQPKTSYVPKCFPLPELDAADDPCGCDEKIIELKIV